LITKDIDCNTKRRTNFGNPLFDNQRIKKGIPDINILNNTRLIDAPSDILTA
jgi:hypothetical protein